MQRPLKTLALTAAVTAALVSASAQAETYVCKSFWGNRIFNRNDDGKAFHRPASKDEFVKLYRQNARSQFQHLQEKGFLVPVAGTEDVFKVVPWHQPRIAIKMIFHSMQARMAEKGARGLSSSGRFRRVYALHGRVIGHVSELASIEDCAFPSHRSDIWQNLCDRVHSEQLFQQHQS